ncbi:MAG: GntR family transcriptional regulator [Peptostreptococcus sp.]|uniref:GntR family transcriptional regulator n=1 Tax=Peptostreptococcus sp. TaxID=1262 RepID=UPI002FCAA99A
MSTIDFNLNNSSPIYLQISKYFQAKVFVGELEPGDIIASRRELASSIRVNLNTVQKAYAHMEEIGLIKTEKNRHSMITDDLKALDLLKEEYIKEPLDIFIKTMKSINISKEQVLNLISTYYDKIDSAESLEDTVEEKSN